MRLSAGLDRFGWALAAITLVGALVRIRVAATEPPHFDESYTALHYVQGSLGELLTTYDEPNNHILGSLLAWLSTGVLGGGPFALRLPALLAGIALVPAIGLLAWRMAPARGTVSGLVAATFVAGAPPLIVYSANARGYSVVLLLLVAQLALTLRLGAPVGSGEGSRHPRALWAWAGWVACGALAIWTVPTALLGIGIPVVWLAALRWRSARSLVPVALAVVATAAACVLLYAPVLGDRGFDVDRFVAAPLKDLATTTAHAWAAGLAAPLLAAALLLALAGAARRPRLGTGAPLTLGLLAVPLAIAVLGRMPPYSRTYLFLFVPLALLAGLGAARLAPALRRGGGGLAVGVGAAFGFVALLAGIGAQTREAWAEDPPGPSQGDLASAVAAMPSPARAGTPGEVAVFVAPRFDLPQVQYVLTQRGLLGAPPLPRRAALGVGPVPVQGDVVVLTRAVVRPAEAVASAGLDPAASEVVSATVRGDAQALVVRRRPPLP
ncbi:MAG: hypothetical protein PGN13_05555 [Patulibacter minatonensis]